MTDAFGRTPISDGMRAQIDATWRRLDAEQPDKRGASLVINGKLHVAGKQADGWKVAAGIGVTWTGRTTSGSVEIVGTW